ncbi:hypothetical protein B0T25DRAFT_359992 [Lasiosphaeria hispida]|uniref:Protein kinase domain-containing protein n=1 Tax=Lasiosphaeria hispida TaxID=260671 RepID=A0AAJ0H8E9_9PEZI|nr:hypothetical protein B0T25DRAFT_359992 [Lasiosphaeria hispida]
MKPTTKFKVSLRAKEKWRKLVDFGRQIRDRVGSQGSQAVPVPGAGVQPAIDAIRGNEFPQELWGADGVPRHGTLRTCNDGGTELLFEASDEVARGEVSTEPVFFAGSQFQHQDSFSRANTIRELDTEDDPEEIARRKLALMDKELRRKSREPFDGPRYYVPVDSLHSVMTRGAIRMVLPGIAKGVMTDLFDQLTQDIYGRHEKEQGTTKSYRKILAILVLIGKADSIVDFVKARVTDDRLPLQKLGIGRRFQLCFTDDHEPIRLFQKWEDRDIEEFENKQWETLAPFFSAETKEANAVRRYELSSRHPLPFEIIPEGTDISKGDNRATSGGTTGSDSSLDSMTGGHGEVLKVRIDRAHHNLQSYRGNEENPALAIKRLLAADREAFKNEVNILTRLNKVDDPHLVKLLLTMEILGRPGKNNSFFLIFPLADSNLRQFWQRNFPHPRGTNTATYVPWVANQLHGLVRALCKLHDLHQREVHSLRDDEDDKKSSTGDPFYGIHGDIKPENLLWYKEWVGPGGAQPAQDNTAAEGSQRTKDRGSKDRFGVLQLADFGISKLHHTETRDNINIRRSTRSYAPPEGEWGVYGCSRSFDIWGLGCVFLEFICWLVQGGSGSTNPVDVFQEARYLQKTNRSLEGTIQDTFYHVVKGKDKTTFEVNPAVKKLINTLRKGTSAFIHDILDIILYDMLVVEPRKTSLKPGAKSHDKSSGGKLRIECIMLAKKLNVILWKGKNNHDYFTKPGPGSADAITKPPQTVTINESATELVKRRSMTRSFSIEKNKEEATKHEQQPRPSTLREVPSK